MNDLQEQIDKQTEWLRTNWKPLAAYTYIAICLFDFILAPILTAFMSAYLHIPYVPWLPLTLQGGAMFHLSFGAILGASAYTNGLAQLEAVKNLPDYSGRGYGGGYGGGFSSPSYMDPINPSLDPPVPLDGTLNAPKRGIGKGQ